MNITNSYNLLADNPFSSGGGGGGGGGSTIIIADNLTTNLGTQALSAKQGVVLKAYVDNLQYQIDNLPTVTIPIGSLTQQGILQLNDDPYSNSKTEAATPNAIRQAIEDMKDYVDNKVPNPSKKGGLVKYEYTFNPTSLGQTDFDIPLLTYDPETFVDIIFTNTIKLMPDKYNIIPKNSSDLTQGYKMVLTTPVTNLNTIFDMILLSEVIVSDDEGLSKFEYVFTLQNNTQTTFEIPLADYKPEKFVDMLFRNTTKLLEGSYTIEKVNPLDENSKYQVRVIDPPNTSSISTYDLVLLTNGFESTSSLNNRVYEGTIPPANTSLIWFETS